MGSKTFWEIEKEKSSKDYKLRLILSTRAGDPPASCQDFVPDLGVLSGEPDRLKRGTHTIVRMLFNFELHQNHSQVAGDARTIKNSLHGADLEYVKS